MAIVKRLQAAKAKTALDATIKELETQIGEARTEANLAASEKALRESRLPFAEALSHHLSSAAIAPAERSDA
ncbi:MAG: hypothetical protein ABL901_18730 [Hyphomicrobiaceae bacterium]